MDADSEFFVVLSTVPSREVGLEIAHLCVNENLAACVSVAQGLISVFKWEGKVDEASESLLLAKTDKNKVGKLISKLKEIHPYEIPEIIAIPIREGYPPYLAWIKSSLNEFPIGEAVDS